VRPSNTLEIAEIGSFHVGGRRAGAPPHMVDPNGELEVEQMYAQYVKLDRPKARYPLLLVHGGGLTGVTYETKPDGQPGWQSYFLHAGHDVYVSDAVERGRASWARYPEIFKSEPFARTKQEAWELFRIGPPGNYPVRAAYPETQFPVEAFDQFAKQAVPRWATNDAATIAAYEAYFRKVGPCVVLAHSQGGNLVLTAGLRVPELIRGFVLVEISGAPDPVMTNLAVFGNVPHLFVWGDYIDDSRSWIQMADTVARYGEALRTVGGSVEWLDLPAVGITGNSHMIMMDRNSDAVAGLIQDWMGRHGLMR